MPVDAASTACPTRSTPPASPTVGPPARGCDQPVTVVPVGMVKGLELDALGRRRTGRHRRRGGPGPAGALRRAHPLHQAPRHRPRAAPARRAHRAGGFRPGSGRRQGARGPVAQRARRPPARAGGRVSPSTRPGLPRHSIVAAAAVGRRSRARRRRCRSRGPGHGLAAARAPDTRCWWSRPATVSGAWRRRSPSAASAADLGSHRLHPSTPGVAAGRAAPVRAAAGATSARPHPSGRALAPVSAHPFRVGPRAAGRHRGASGAGRGGGTGRAGPAPTPTPRSSVPVSARPSGRASTSPTPGSCGTPTLAGWRASSPAGGSRRRRRSTWPVAWCGGCARSPPSCIPKAGSAASSSRWPSGCRWRPAAG